MATVISELKVIDGQTWVTKKLGSDAKYITYTPSGGQETTLNTAIDSISNDVTLNNKAVNFMTSGNKANSNLAYDVNKFTLGGGDYITSANNDEGMNPKVTMNSLALNGTGCTLVQSVTPSGCSMAAKVMNVTSGNVKSEVTGKTLYQYYWSTDESSIYVGNGSSLSASYDSNGGTLTKVSSNIIGSSKFPIQQAWGSKSSYNVKSTVPIVQTTGAIALGSEIDMWSGTGSMTNVKPSAIIKDDTTNSEIVIKNGDSSKTKGLYVQNGIGTAGDLVVGSGVTTTSGFKNGGNIISKGCVVSKSGMSIGYDPDDDWNTIISNVGQSDGGGNLAVKGNITSSGLIKGATATLTGSSSYSTQVLGISKGMVLINDGRLQVTKDSTNGIAASGIYLTGKGYGLQINRTNTTTTGNPYTAKMDGGQVYISSSDTFDNNNVPALFVNNSSYLGGSKNHINGTTRIRQMEAGFSGAVAPNTGSESVTFSTNWTSGTTISAQTKDSSNTSYYADALTVKNGRTVISGTNSSGVGLRVDKDISVGGGVTSGGTVTATSLVTDSLTWNNSSTASLSVGSLTTNGITVNGTSSLKGKATITTGGLAVTGATTLNGNTSVTGTLTSSGKLTVSANGAAITGATSVSGNLSTTGTLTVDSTSTLKNKLTVSKGGLSVTGGTGLVGDLSVTGTSTLSGNVTTSNIYFNTGNTSYSNGKLYGGTYKPINAEDSEDLSTLSAIRSDSRLVAENGLAVQNWFRLADSLSTKDSIAGFSMDFGRSFGSKAGGRFNADLWFKTLNNSKVGMLYRTMSDGDDTDQLDIWTLLNIAGRRTNIYNNAKNLYIRPMVYNAEKDDGLITLLDFLYPVGSICVNHLESFNPANYYGGTWERLGGGLFLMSAGTQAYGNNIYFKSDQRSGTRVMVAGGGRGLTVDDGWANQVMVANMVADQKVVEMMPPYYSTYFWLRTA